MDHTNNNNNKNKRKIRRRSTRNTNSLNLSDRSSLQYRRLEQLFFRRQQAAITTEGDDDNKDQQQHYQDDDDGYRRRRRSLRFRRRTCRDDDDDDDPTTEPSAAAPPTTLTTTIGKHTLTRVSMSPNIYVIDEFLTSHELDYFHSVIKTCQFQKSFVDDSQNGTSTIDTNHRTSSFINFPKQHNKVVQNVELKAANLLGCYSTTNIEPLQLIRYLPGQFFGIHHDLGDYYCDDNNEQDNTEESGENVNNNRHDTTTTTNETIIPLPPKNIWCKRRLVTIFCYLNTVEVGGATYFPNAGNSGGGGLRIQPTVAGRAVLFSNINELGMPDPRTIHAGEPPLQQCIKYGLNIWICED